MHTPVIVQIHEHQKAKGAKVQGARCKGTGAKVQRNSGARCRKATSRCREKGAENEVQRMRCRRVCGECVVKECVECEQITCVLCCMIVCVSVCEELKVCERRL